MKGSELSIEDSKKHRQIEEVYLTGKLPYREEDIRYPKFETARNWETDTTDLQEYDLAIFSKWYANLPFSKLSLSSPEDNEGRQWMLSVLYIVPSPGRDNYLVSEAQKYAYEFYKDVFDASNADRDCMKKSVKKHATIMIIARKKIPGLYQPGRIFISNERTACRSRNPVHVVASCTFVPSSTLPGPVFIMWLGVSRSTNFVPAILGQWRQRGFGTFLIISLIKWICAKDQSKELIVDVPLYLQTADPKALGFYYSLGFQRINDNNDGYHFLPTELVGVVDMESWIPDDGLTQIDGPRCELLFLPTNNLRKPSYHGKPHPTLSTTDLYLKEVGCKFCTPFLSLIPFDLEHEMVRILHNNMGIYVMSRDVISVFFQGIYHSLLSHDENVIILDAWGHDAKNHLKQLEMGKTKHCFLPYLIEDDDEDNHWILLHIHGNEIHVYDWSDKKGMKYAAIIQSFTQLVRKSRFGNKPKKKQVISVIHAEREGGISMCHEGPDNNHCGANVCANFLVCLHRLKVIPQIHEYEVSHFTQSVLQSNGARRRLLLFEKFFKWCGPLFQDKRQRQIAEAWCCCLSKYLNSPPRNGFFPIHVDVTYNTPGCGLDDEEHEKMTQSESALDSVVDVEMKEFVTGDTVLDEDMKESEAIGTLLAKTDIDAAEAMLSDSGMSTPIEATVPLSMEMDKALNATENTETYEGVVNVERNVTEVMSDVPMQDSVINLCDLPEDKDAMERCNTFKRDFEAFWNSINNMKKSFLWVEFPFSNDAEELSPETMGICLQNLNLLKTILPRQNLPFLPKHKLKYLSGEMCNERRILHSLSAGKEWLLSSEEQLMMSMIVGNGCFNREMFIVPLHFMDILKDGYKKFCAWNKAVQKDEYGDSTKHLGDLYHDQQDTVTNDVILPIIKKYRNLKFLFFPIHDAQRHHWKALVVFNPLHIKPGKGYNPDVTPRTCFFMFDSLMNDDAYFEHKDGIIWFLNLLYSVKMWKDGKVAGMEWLCPFGESSPRKSTRLQGTKLFPRLRLAMQGAYLPRQVDGWNCGISIVAVLGIFCRDFLLRHEDPMENWFTHKNMPVQQFENFGFSCKVPEGKMQQLPSDIVRTQTEGSQTMGEDYLQVLRREFFVCFDRLRLVRKDKSQRTDPTSIQTHHEHLLKVHDKNTSTWPYTNTAYYRNFNWGSYTSDRKQPPDNPPDIGGIKRRQDTAEKEFKLCKRGKKTTKEIIEIDDDSKPAAAEASTNQLFPGVSTIPGKMSRKKPSKSSIHQEKIYYYRRPSPEPAFTSSLKDTMACRSVTSQSYIQAVSPDYAMNEEKLHSFIAEMFKAWGWLSKEEFQEFMNDISNMRDVLKSAMEQQTLNEYMEECMKQRSRIVCLLRNEYMVTKLAHVVGLEYKVPTLLSQGTKPKIFPAWREDIPKIQEKKFRGMLNWKRYNERTHNYDVMTEMMVLEDEWVLDSVSEDFVMRVKKPRTDGKMILLAPADEQMILRIHTTEFTRVMYNPPASRRIPDIEELRKYYSTANEGNEKTKKGIPHKIVNIEGSWKAMLSDFNEVAVSESELVAQYGASFVEFAKTRRDKYVDIPRLTTIEDSTESKLDMYPNLRRDAAPVVRYTIEQLESNSASKSFASVLYSIGLFKAADDMNTMIENGQFGIKSDDNLIHLAKMAKYVLPTWLQFQKVKHMEKFNWEVDINSRVIFVGMMICSDGVISHAVTLHDGYIYDAFETVAIPLCHEGLDYCTSNKSHKRQFLRFVKGIKFVYKGKEQQMEERMTAKLHMIPKRVTKKRESDTNRKEKESNTDLSKGFMPSIDLLHIDD